jgi:hypothetical protein
MVVSALQNADTRLSRWLDGMETLKYLRALKSNGVHLPPDEVAQFRTALPQEGGYIHTDDWFRADVEDEDDLELIEMLLDLLAWVKAQPKERHPAYARLLRDCDEAKSLFGKAMSTTQIDWV